MMLTCFQSMLCQNVRLSYLQGCPYRDSVSLPHFVNQMSSKACTCSNFKEPLRLEPIEIMKSNMDSLSTIITFGALLGKVSPVQLTTLGLFQSMLYHANRFAIDLTLGAVDDMGGATVTHVFGAVYGTATSIMIYKTHPGFDHPEHNSRYVSGLYVILNVYNVLKTPLFFILIVLAGMPFGAPCGYGLLSLLTMVSLHQTTCASVWS